MCQMASYVFTRTTQLNVILFDNFLSYSLLVWVVTYLAWAIQGVRIQHKRPGEYLFNVIEHALHLILYFPFVYLKWHLPFK